MSYWKQCLMTHDRVRASELFFKVLENGVS